ncbi:Rho GTPase-activating protein 27 [Rhizophlyctis rosea]|nr:Rho GTPase-activating protein 27 [Rhizophlyctis rosea]
MEIIRQEPSVGPIESTEADVDPFQDPTAADDVTYPPTIGTGYSSDTDAVLVQREDVDDVPELDVEDDLDTIDEWRTVTNSDGSVYYWNVITGETTWELPPDLEIVPDGEAFDYPEENMDAGLSYEFDTSYYTDGDMLETRHQPRSSVGSEELLSTTPPNQSVLSSTAEDEAKVDDYLASQIEYVPPEIIRLEGNVTMKKLKDSGGREPKKSGWQSYWGVVCVGYLILYKDDPAKLRKKSDKVYPSCVIRLNSLTADPASKDQAKRKNVILISLDDGVQWLIQPQNEGDFNGWMDTVKEASKERSTPTEYENASSKLFSGPRAEDLAALKKGKEEKDISRKLTGGKDKKMDRSQSGDLIAEEEGTNNKTKVKTKLGAFFSKRPPVNALKEKGIMMEDAPPSPHVVFGGLLEAQLQKEGKSIPTFVEQCVQEVERRGLQSQGIYRLSGNAATIQKIKSQYNAGEPVQLDDETLDINVVSGSLKLYFRELQNPLIPYEYYERFIEAAKISTYDDRLIEIKSLVHALPKPNFDVLEYLMKHLCRVADESDINKMEPPNLAIVFGPTLVRMPDEGQAAYVNMMNMAFQNGLVEAIIRQTEWVFSPIETIPVEEEGASAEDAPIEA